VAQVRARLLVAQVRARLLGANLGSAISSPRCLSLALAQQEPERRFLARRLEELRQE